MNTDLWLIGTLTGSNKHGKSAKDISFTDLVKILNMAETASASNVQASETHATGTYPSKTRHGMNLLNA